MEALSPRQYQMMTMIVCGVAMHDWARLNGLSRHTAEGYSLTAQKKLDARSLAQAGVRFVTAYNYFLNARGLILDGRAPRIRPVLIKMLEPHEMRIYDLLSAGYHRGEIAVKMNWPEMKVSNTLSRSYYKLGAWTRTQAVVHYKLLEDKLTDIGKSGWVPPEMRDYSSSGVLDVSQLEFLERLAGLGGGLMLLETPDPNAVQLMRYGYLSAVTQEGQPTARLVVTKAGYEMVEIRNQLKRKSMR